MSARSSLPAWSATLILAAGLCSPARGAAQKPTPQDAAASGGQVALAAPRSQRVQFRNGLLSIVAQNSTLGEILAAVRAETGARLEFPRPGAEERVTVRLGPGRPRDVLAALLNGSRYNYILLGTPQNPAGVAHMILTERGSAPPSPPMPAPPPPVAHLPEPEEENQEGEVVPEPPTEVPAETTPPAAPADQPPQVKTPQQLLQELQERLKLQQQQREDRSENPEQE